jgi:hypothetical protein
LVINGGHDDGPYQAIWPIIGIWYRLTMEPMTAQDASVGEGHDVAGLDRARSMALGRSVMKRIRIERRRTRNERSSLEPLSPDPRDPDIVRAKALARTARSAKATGK